MTHPFHFALIQFLLATVILLLDVIFTRGFTALFHKAPNMDTLVAVGTGAPICILYSLISILRAICMPFTACILNLPVSLWRWCSLESIWKAFRRRNPQGISALLQLRPSNATLLRDGKEVEIQAEEITIGDPLVVKPESIFR